METRRPQDESVVEAPADAEFTCGRCGGLFGHDQVSQFGPGARVVMRAVLLATGVDQEGRQEADAFYCQDCRARMRAVFRGCLGILALVFLLAFVSLLVR